MKIISLSKQKDEIATRCTLNIFRVEISLTKFEQGLWLFFGYKENHFFDIELAWGLGDS